MPDANTTKISPPEVTVDEKRPPAPASRIDDECPLTLYQVLTQELRHIRPATPGIDQLVDGDKPSAEVAGEDNDSKCPSGGDLNAVFKAYHGQKLAAICLSGGGIRSATFALGVVEALAKEKMLPCFDYLSTVSGGGYLGSWLSGWIRREQQIRNERLYEMSGEKLWSAYQRQDSFGVKSVQKKLNDKAADSNTRFDPAVEPKQMQFLREYSNYMTPRVGLLSADTWTFVSIYLRNLTLNWTIFLPMLGVLLLLPRLFLAAVAHHVPAPNVIWWVAFVIVLSVVWVLTGVLTSLPGSDPPPESKDWRNDQGIMLRAILPLVGGVALTCVLMSWYAQLPADWKGPFDVLTLNFWGLDSLGLTYFIAVPAIIYVVLKLMVGVSRTGRVKHKLVAFSVATIAFLCTIFGNSLVVYLYRHLDIENSLVSPKTNQLYAAFSVPVVLLAFLAAATLFVGLGSMLEPDSDREWFARFGAWILIICLAWVFIFSVSFWGPDALAMVAAAVRSYFGAHIPSSDNGEPATFWGIVTAIVGTISGVVSLFGGFSSKSKARPGAENTRLQMLFTAAPQIAAVIFFVFIFAAIALLIEVTAPGIAKLLARLFQVGAFVLGYFGHQATTGVAEIFAPPADGQQTFGLRFTLVYGAILMLIGVGMSLFLNANKFSLHGAYRDRLIRAYLGASKLKRDADPFTGFDDRDNFQLHRMKGQRPFHVINGTLNLVDGEKLAWQNRKAASFIMTPLHCGSWASEGFRNTFEYGRNRQLGRCSDIGACNMQGESCGKVENCQLPGKALRVGTAMTISGAAVNPNMGYHSSPVVMFLMALFNVRLGWWLGNTNKSGGDRSLVRRYYQKAGPTLSVLPLLSETFGRTDKDRRFINVSDGGHFDNLGLYEMVMRRCKYIIVSDASADNDFAFDDLATAIDLCEVDLGVKIVFRDGIEIEKRTLDVKKRRLSRKQKEVDNLRWAVAEIHYPETPLFPKGHEKEGQPDPEHYGWLLYVKPAYRGDEPIELKHYAEAHPTFPHQSTVDQLFDERQFEAYRELGALTMAKVFEAKASSPDPRDVDQCERIRKLKAIFSGINANCDYANNLVEEKKPPPASASISTEEAELATPEASEEIESS